MKVSIFAVIFLRGYSSFFTFLVPSHFMTSIHQAKPTGIAIQVIYLNTMKSSSIKLLVFFTCMAGVQWASAQGSAVSGFGIFGYILVAMAVLLVLAMVVIVSENLLFMESRRLGLDPKNDTMSVLPKFSELFRSSRPAFTGSEPLVPLRKGHDILLEGEPLTKNIEQAAWVTHYAVLPKNFLGLSPIPKLMVEVGQEVLAGDVLFYDKRTPEIHYSAPVSGEVIAVNRGPKRAIHEVVILADKQIKYREFPSIDLAGSTRDEIAAYIMEAGAWPLLKQRPYNLPPDPAVVPRDIFISTFDSAPLAPDQNLIVDGKGYDFQKGIDVLARLTSGKVYLGMNAGGDAPATEFLEADNCQRVWFKGKHPAGNVGVQIHHIKPIASGQAVWTLGVQDVLTLGTLFNDNKFDVSRVVALTGNELKKPTYVRSFLGANIGELLKDNLKDDHVRIVSGDVLSGEQKNQSQYLNAFDDQITVLKEGDYNEMLGWLLPAAARPSISKTYLSTLFSDIKYKADTNTHGEKRAFVMTGQYEQVLPMNIYPQHLMKAILTKDLERMEGLGLLELCEEDVALCEFVCTSKQPLQKILKEGLELMRAEG